MKKQLIFLLFIFLSAGTINAMGIIMPEGVTLQKKHKHLKHKRHPFGHLKHRPRPTTSKAWQAPSSRAATASTITAKA